MPVQETPIIAEFAKFLGTLAAAFFGAFFAFRFNAHQLKESERAKNIAAVNRVLFHLFEQLNTLQLYKRDFLDPVRDHKGRHIALEAMMPGVLTPVTLRLTEISFLATRKHAQILFDLSVEQSRYDTAMTAVSVFSRIHLDQVQPKMMAMGARQGQTVTNVDVENALGDLLHETIRKAAEQVFYSVDQSVDTLPQVKDRLRAVALEVYPDAEFINFEAVVD